MVASDTVVGLVGAGILLVALVGVFVYESQQTGTGPTDLQAGTHEFTADGTASNRAASGTRVPTTQTCAPGQTCVDPQTSVDLTLKGLPDPREAKYVVYAEGVLVTALTKSGNDTYSTGGAKSISQQKNSVTVYLEPSGSQASPSGPKVFEKTGIGTSPTSLKGNGIFVALGSGATLSVSYASSTNLTVTVNGATNYNNFVYRAWMVDDTLEGKTFTHVGNGTMSEGAIQIQGAIPQAAGSYSYLLVTLDPRGGFNAAAPKGPDIARTGL